MIESIIDFPKNSLCKEIWKEDFDNNKSLKKWEMLPDVKQKILQLVDKILSLIKLPVDDKIKKINITGSITSNQYTELSDIDLHLHFQNFKSEDNELLQKNILQALNTLRASDKESTYINKHPIEIYYQPNEFQDYMSIGCYDIINDKWLVGPEIIDLNFNPYQKYYKKIKNNTNKILHDVRDQILNCYEKAIIVKKINDGQKNIDSNILNMAQNDLIEALKKSSMLYDSMRNTRKVYSSPISIEDALKKRESIKWKIADASFKLFDKFGYLAILKEFKNIYLDIKDDIYELDLSDYSIDIISTVKKYLGNEDKLLEIDIINEGINKNISIGLLASLLAIPNFQSKADVYQLLKTERNPKIVKQQLNKQIRMIGNYTARKTANIIARTLYAEAREDGYQGLMSVASVIYNRANGDINNFVDVCKKHGKNKSGNTVYQFSCWNSMKDYEWDPVLFDDKIPKSVLESDNNKKLWNEAMEISAIMLAKKFKPIITSNSYYNPDKANPLWGDQLTNTKKIGHHIFGYLKYHTAFI